MKVSRVDLRSVFQGRPIARLNASCRPSILHRCSCCSIWWDRAASPRYLHVARTGLAAQSTSGDGADQSTVRPKEVLGANPISFWGQLSAVTMRSLLEKAGRGLC